MDPITLFSILFKMPSLDIDKNKILDKEQLNKKSRTEIIQLYRSTMTQPSNKNF